MKRIAAIIAKTAAALTITTAALAAAAPVFANEANEEEVYYKRLCTTEVFELPGSAEVSHTAVIATEVILSSLF